MKVYQDYAEETVYIDEMGALYQRVARSEGIGGSYANPRREVYEFERLGDGSGVVPRMSAPIIAEEDTLP